MTARSSTLLRPLIKRLQSGTRKDCRTRTLRLESLEEKRLLTSVGVLAGTTGEDPGASRGAWQIGRSGSADYPCFVSFHLGGTAAYGSDYILRDANDEIVSAYSFYDEETASYRYGGSISVAPHSESATLYVCPINDAERELPETATLELVGYFCDGVSGAASGSASITIEDNDAWTVSVAATDATAGETSATESNPGVYVISRSGETDATHALYVSFRMTGSASTSDYSLYAEDGSQIRIDSNWDSETETYLCGGGVNIPAGRTSVAVELRPRNDADREETETAVMTLVPSVDEYGYGAYAVAGESAQVAIEATVSIEDNDAWTVSVAATDATAGETSATESNPGIYTISRSGETDATHALYVSFRMTGSASTSDYSLYAEDGSQIRIDSNWDSETGTYLCGGGINIPAGRTSVAVELRPRNDAEREETETAVMTLIPSVDEYGYGVYAVAGESAQISIEDNDHWTVSISASGTTTSEEDASGVSLLFARSGETDLSHPLAVSFQLSGSANSSDYELRTESGALVSLSSNWDSTRQTTLYSGTIAIPANESDVALTFRALDDRFAERDETTTLTLLPSAYYAVDAALGSASITIEETAEVRLTTLDAVAPEPRELTSGTRRGAAFRLATTTTETNWSAIAVRLNVSGSATAGDDYYLTTDPNGGSSGTIFVANGQATVMIPSGQNVLDFYAFANVDDVFEIDEEIILTLAEAHSATPDNLVDVFDEDCEPARILQAPEFISGADANPPERVNFDGYSKWIDPEANYAALLGDETILAAIPSGRSCRYSFYDPESGDSPTSSASDPLLRVDETTGVITVLRAMTAAELSNPPTPTVKVCDSEYPELYDLATLTLSPIVVDLDIDSDNTYPGINGQPDRDEEEDFLEMHPFAPGKIIKPNWGDSDGDGVLDCWDGYSIGGYDQEVFCASVGFYPIVLQIPDFIPLSAMKIQLEYKMAGVIKADGLDFPDAYGEGTIRIWKKDGFAPRDGATVAERGDRVAPCGIGVFYDPENLGFTESVRTITLYVEGVTENAQKTRKLAEQLKRPNTTIKFSVTIGNSATEEKATFEDEVRYVVANEGSFYYELMTHPELVSTYASNLVYDRQNSDILGLQIQSDAELQKQGLRNETATVIFGDALPENMVTANPITLLTQDDNTSGFGAALYREYVTGKYVLAFAGTRFSSLEDWATNLAQAFSRDGVAQYNLAKFLGKKFEELPQLASKTYITGHSLGGGLASAATVVSGIRAYTFNAAGLHPDTVEGCRHLADAEQLIDAFHVDYDILTWGQWIADWLRWAIGNNIPSAVGRSIEIDSQYDAAMMTEGVLAVAGKVSQNYSLIAIAGLEAVVGGFKCHCIPQVIYGMEQRIFHN